jgi:hypothetical protein
MEVWHQLIQQRLLVHPFISFAPFDASEQSMPPKADSNKMAAAHLDAVCDAFVNFSPIGGDGDGRMVKKTGAMWGHNNSEERTQVAWRLGKHREQAK